MEDGLSWRKLMAWVVYFLKARLMQVQKASHQSAVKPLNVRMEERDMQVLFFLDLSLSSCDRK